MPLKVAVAVFEVYHAERIPEPGANRSRQEPKFENDERASVVVVDPTTVDVKFIKPLVLPARVGVYTRDNQVWVGDAPSGPAYLTGTFEEK